MTPLFLILTGAAVIMALVGGWVWWLIRSAPIAYEDPERGFCLGTPPEDVAREQTDPLASEPSSSFHHVQLHSAREAHDHG